MKLQILVSIYDVWSVSCHYLISFWCYVLVAAREDFKNISVERFVTDTPHTGHNLILKRLAESWNISIKMFILLAAVSVLQSMSYQSV